MKTYGKKSFELPFDFKSKDNTLVEAILAYLNRKAAFNLKRITHQMFNRAVFERDFANSSVGRMTRIFVRFTVQEHENYFQNIVSEAALFIKAFEAGRKSCP